MMKKLAVVAFALVITAAGPVAAQPKPVPLPKPGVPAPAPVPTLVPPEQPPPPAQPAPLPAPEPPRGQPVNIRLDVTIVDENGPAPSRKSVSLTLADRQSGQVRAEVFVLAFGNVPLAMDALPVLETGGRIRTRVTLDYQPNPGEDRGKTQPKSMRLSFGVLLENGKKIVAAQAADPVTDRRVSVEIMATVLK